MKKVTLEKLELEVNQIKLRNSKVEADKAWETSNFRKVLVAILTYIVISLFFWVSGNPEPLFSALVPTLGFLLSTLSIPVFKRYWIKSCHKKHISR